MRWPQPQISYVHQLKEFYKKTNLEVQTHKTYQAAIIEVDVSTFHESLGIILPFPMIISFIGTIPT